MCAHNLKIKHARQKEKASQPSHTTRRNTTQQKLKAHNKKLSLYLSQLESSLQNETKPPNLPEIRQQSPERVREMISNTLTRSLGRQLQLSRSYVSRAHPKPTPEFALPKALEMVLTGVEERKVKRQEKWDRNAPKRQSKGIQDNGPYRNQDETVELAINLNLDPRRAGQSLRGSISLPHGTGKQVNCIVFTSDSALAEEALKNGASYAGGEELVDKIIAGEIPLGDLQRALATNDIMSLIQKQLARLLGPRGLMPNPKVNTVFKTSDELLESLKEQARNITYRTESNGIIHFPIGKGSFGPDRLMDNIQQICQTIQDVKPEQYGKGKKKKMGKNVKYWLRAHLSSTQGSGVRVDLKTVDPTSPFFLKDPETV